MKMAKMHLTRASIRRAARVTPSPPPSPKTPEDLKPLSDWSLRLRHHGKHSAGSLSGKSSPQNGERIRSRTSSASSSSNDHCWNLRRSTRLNGISAEVDVCFTHTDSLPSPSPAGPQLDFSRRKRKTVDEKLLEENHSLRSTKSMTCKLRSGKESQSVFSAVNGRTHSVKDNQPEVSLPLKKRKLIVDEASTEADPLAVVIKTEPAVSLETSPTNGLESETCSKCQTKPKRTRTMDSLLKESERFMQYPSRTWRSRATHNSCDSNTHTSTANTSPHNTTNYLSACSLDGVARVEFSFEMIPTQATWYQTFTREEEVFPKPSDTPAPFLLPYEMPLDSVLRKNRGVRKQEKPKTSFQFRPIISTRLQMQRFHSTKEKRPAKTKKDPQVNKLIQNCTMPRKSPRCHASTLAILCAKRERKEVEAAPPGVASNAETSEDDDVELLLGKILEDRREKMVVAAASGTEAPKKRGRPRKTERPTASPISHLISATLDQINELVDETVTEGSDSFTLGDTEDLAELVCAIPDLLETKSTLTEESTDLYDLNYLTDDKSNSSVYETASELGSTSTSGSLRTSRRRKKRPNMTGWPRTKKRKSPVAKFSDLSESESLSADSYHSPSQNGDANGHLSTIHEESSFMLLATGESNAVPNETSPRLNLQLSKPFQFQRKTLRFVGKRILRQESQRHAPQRLEYWPCFSSCRKPRRRKVS